MSEESRSIGSPRFVPVPVSMRGTTKSLTGRSPEQIAQDHSFVLELLFRVPSLSSPALALSGAGLTARVSSLFATSPDCVHSSRGFPRPRYVPSAGALNLSTAFSALRLSGLFHPAAASRALCSFRGFPSPRSDRASSVRSAPLPLCPPAARQDES